MNKNNMKYLLSTSFILDYITLHSYGNPMCISQSLYDCVQSVKKTRSHLCARSRLQSSFSGPTAAELQQVFSQGLVDFETERVRPNGLLRQNAQESMGKKGRLPCLSNIYFHVERYYQNSLTSKCLSQNSVFHLSHGMPWSLFSPGT